MNQDSLDQVVHYKGNVKYFIKGNKVYRPVLSVMRHTKMLRKNFKTATGAENYGKSVTKRYLGLVEKYIPASETPEMVPE